MRNDYAKLLGLPEGIYDDPEGHQLEMELKRDMVLVWFLQELISEHQDYEMQILTADLSDPKQVAQVMKWQAKREQLEVWLGRFVEMKQEQDYGDQRDE